LNRLDTIEAQIKEGPDSQVSKSDPDSRSMTTSGKGTAIVGYNVQSAVDDKHHLIVAHEVTNRGNDRDQLTSMSVKAKEATGIENPEVYADRGYYSSKEKGLNIRMYWSSKCLECQMKSNCTTSKYRRIRRWEHEDILDKMQKRLNDNPQASRIRRQTVEHVFGTLKSWMGSTHSW